MPLDLSRAANFPMALDEDGKRLFIGTRTPPRLVIADTQSHPTAEAECAGDADDLFYDNVRSRVYVTGGEGFIDVFDARPDGHYRRLARVPSARGARTSLWVPASSRLYVAAPSLNGGPATLLIYQAQTK